MIRKVTSQVFNDTKRLIASYSSFSSVARVTGLSASTVGLINQCSLYEDYLALVKDRNEKADNKLKAMNLRMLSGEPLFWKIHSECRGFSVPSISIWSGISKEEIRKMRRASSYAEYLRSNDNYTRQKPERTTVSEKDFKEIRFFLQDGYSDKEIIELFGCAESVLDEVKKYSTWEEYQNAKQKHHNKCVWINDGLKQIIEDGINQGLSNSQIAAETGVGFASVTRIRKGTHRGNPNLITEKTYNALKKNPSIITRKTLAEKISQSKNYKEFSLMYYAGKKKVSWETEEEIPETEIQEKIEEVSKESIEPVKIEEKPMKPMREVEDKIKIEDTFPSRTSVSSKDISTNQLLKYKYRGIFILTGELITGLIGLGLIALLK